MQKNITKTRIIDCQTKFLKKLLKKVTIKKQVSIHKNKTTCFSFLKKLTIFFEKVIFKLPYSKKSEISQLFDFYNFG